MVQGEDPGNLGHTGHADGWDHGFGAGHGFSWGAPNPYGMDPISHNEGGDLDLNHSGRYGMVLGHKGSFGSGVAGWGNAGTGDMLETDQEIGDGDFEPHHPLVVKPGRGHFHHGHNHGVGYGFNAGYKSEVPKGKIDNSILKNINEAIESEFSNINVEANKMKEENESKKLSLLANAKSRIETKSNDKSENGISSVGKSASDTQELLADDTTTKK